MERFATKGAAKTAAKAVLAKMKGKGWKIEVHDNMQGWSFQLRLGPVQLYQSCDEYWCLIGTDVIGSGGLAMWTESDLSTKRFSKDPNKAVQRAVTFARSVVDGLSEILKVAEDGLSAAEKN